MDKQRVKEYLLCASLTVLLVFALINYSKILGWLLWVLGILSPVFIGGAVAFILSKPFNFLEKTYIDLFPRIKNKRIHTAAALLTVYIVLFGAVTLLIWFVIPQLSQSVNLLINNFDSYYKNLRQFLDNLSHRIDFDIWNELKIESRIAAIKNELPDLVGRFFPEIFSFTTSVIGRITDFVLGLVLSVYLLVEKRTLAMQSTRLMGTFFPEKVCAKVVDFVRLVGRNFSNFISGQLTDALILGIMCFVGMKVFRFDYAFLISVIVAITNIIPIVGPIIGSIPSAFILLLVNPVKAFWFVIFIIVLQQIEANLIYPRVVGNSVGLPAIWVLIAVIVGGGMFGILGMILGIPIMSIIYEIIGQRLKKKYD